MKTIFNLSISCWLGVIIIGCMDFFGDVLVTFKNILVVVLSIYGVIEVFNDANYDFDKLFDRVKKYIVSYKRERLYKKIKSNIKSLETNISFLIKEKENVLNNLDLKLKNIKLSNNKKEKLISNTFVRIDKLEVTLERKQKTLKFLKEKTHNLFAAEFIQDQSVLMNTIVDTLLFDTDFPRYEKMQQAIMRNQIFIHDALEDARQTRIMTCEMDEEEIVERYNALYKSRK